MQVCVQVSSEICKVLLEIVLYLQNNWSSVTESAALSMGVTKVLPLFGVLTFCRAIKALGFSTCFSGMWTCALGAGGPLHEVFDGKYLYLL